jgi:hypothetical protein
MAILDFYESQELVARVFESAADVEDAAVRAELYRAATQLAWRVAILARLEPEGSA